jgi:predicted nucleic acid-binding Zn ribbon protein
MAAEHAQAKVNAARQQLQVKAQQADYAGGVDMGAHAVMAAPARPQGDASRCGMCGVAMADGVRFCSQCGTARVETGCPGCGAALAANAKFCAQCGTRIA